MNLKKYGYLLLLSLLVFSVSCSNETATRDKKMKAAAGLPPIAGIAKIIGGKRFETVSMLPQGRTPHDFTPRIETVKQISDSAIFFSTGMPFEQKIENFLRSKAKICDVSQGIRRIAFHDGGDHHHHHHDGCSHDDHDPHVWLSPANAIIIANNIADEFIRLDPEGEKYYRDNLAKLKSELIDMDKKFTSALAPFRGKMFFVYHPAFGYFADSYSLKQRAIELNGREAAPVQLAQIIKEAKLNNISVIFVQEQFNPGSAEAIARQINGTVAPLDPLAENLPENLKKIANSLIRGFDTEKK